MAKTQKVHSIEEAAKKRAKGVITQKERQETQEQQVERAQVIARWQEEIKSLSDQKFASVEEAVSMIARNVVTKLNFDDERGEETKKFIMDLLLTDPSIVEKLKVTLKIK